MLVTRKIFCNLKRLKPNLDRKLLIIVRECFTEIGPAVLGSKETDRQILQTSENFTQA